MSEAVSVQGLVMMISIVSEAESLARDRHQPTDRQTDRQTGRQAHRQAGRQAGRQAHRQRDTDSSILTCSNSLTTLKTKRARWSSDVNVFKAKVMLNRI